MKESQKERQSTPAGKVELPDGKWIYLFIILIITIVFLSSEKGPQKTTWQLFELEMLPGNTVEKIDVVNREKAEIYIKQEFVDDPRFSEVMKPMFGSGTKAGPHFFIIIGSVEVFDKNLREAQRDVFVNEHIPVQYINRSNWFANILAWMLPFIFILGLWIFILRRATGGMSTRGSSSIFSFGKSTAKLVEKDTSKITFDDIAGLEEAEQEIREIIDFLKNPELYTRLGAKIPKGVIIVGPPGTGKTLLAKAVAGEAQVPFYSISGSEFVEMFVGVGASRVRDLFSKAKEKAPSIIFIDEIDAIGRSRGKGAFLSGANDERESTLNQLLTEMDGFGTNMGVIVMAATNRADILDPALLRPGRFDRHIYLELPNLNERVEIFKVHMRPLIIDDSVDPAFLASQTPGFSGADIANICNESALIAAREKKSKISKDEFTQAIDRVVGGLEKKSKIISTEERKTIAFHEAGHALISWLLPQVDSLVKVSIIPRGKSLGAAWYLPEERQLKTKEALTQQISAMLGGRAAEEVEFSEVSSGALDDLEKVTQLAYMMIMYYGFNEKIGHISFFDSTGQRENALHKPYSEETGRLIDEEVRKLVDEAYNKARSILQQHKNQLRKLANELLEKETIFKEDIQKILGERPQVSSSKEEGLEVSNIV